LTQPSGRLKGNFLSKRNLFSVDKSLEQPERVLLVGVMLTADYSGANETRERGFQTALTEFGAVIMRTDPPFDMQYLYATQLLTLAESQGAKVFNSGQAMRDFNEKLAILKDNPIYIIYFNKFHYLLKTNFPCYNIIRNFCFFFPN